MSQITTHILDTSRGLPAENVAVSLYQQIDDDWTLLASGKTNADGRVAGLLPDDKKLDGGTYKLLFEVEPYFQANQTASFYPYVEIVFSIAGDGQHYHVPLLLNPYGYSTYRGS